MNGNDPVMSVKILTLAFVGECQLMCSGNFEALRDSIHEVPSFVYRQDGFRTVLRSNINAAVN